MSGRGLVQEDALDVVVRARLQVVGVHVEDAGARCRPATAGWYCAAAEDFARNSSTGRISKSAFGSSEKSFGTRPSTRAFCARVGVEQLLAASV